MKAVTKAGVNIGYVYDLGNWRFVGEDERAAAELLKDYVQYIHVKDVQLVDQNHRLLGLIMGKLIGEKFYKFYHKTFLSQLSIQQLLLLKF